VATVQGLNAIQANSVQYFQLYLFGGIFLEPGPGNPGRNEGGILISDYAPGQAVRTEITDSRIILSVSFDDGPGTLVFAGDLAEPDGTFRLQYDASAPGNGSKGLTWYGGARYAVDFLGQAPPFLSIQAAHNKVIRVNARTLPGRRVLSAEDDSEQGTVQPFIR